MHNCKYGRVRPATNTEFWQTKRQGNVARDKKNLKTLKDLGWKVLVIWECQIKKPEKVTEKIVFFLKHNPAPSKYPDLNQLKMRDKPKLPVKQTL